MLEESFGLLFYLKKPKNYSKGQLPIYLRITVGEEHQRQKKLEEKNSIEGKKL